MHTMAIFSVFAICGHEENSLRLAMVGEEEAVGQAEWRQESVY